MRLLCAVALFSMPVWLPSAGSPAPVEFGSIAGSVIDPSGAVIPGAQVTVSNESTGKEHSRKTGFDGFYRLGGLAPGSYTVRFSAQVFKTETRTSVPVRSRQTTLLEAKLGVGAASGEIKLSVGATSSADVAPPFLVVLEGRSVTLDNPAGDLAGTVVDPQGSGIAGRKPFSGFDGRHCEFSKNAY